ncbi:MAG: TonB-dependent receptor [Pseudomonadales bacterium]|nr:TonB-dependent receptor [Pseudomonadales bacterium]
MQSLPNRLNTSYSNRKHLRLSIALIMLGHVAAPAFAAEEMLIIGSREDARRVAGSGSVISREQIHQEAANDINQLLKTVPGLYIREEDGAGLRPNIGIRGATSERSSKITVMEDGVMVSPAPYSDPAAYYFPTALRQNAVEVLKGAPLLRYGPQTTGGVINLVSTPIPQQLGGSLEVSGDHRGSNDVHGWVGSQQGQWSWLVETAQRNGEGFKDVDRSNNEGGFLIEDYLAKLGWQSAGDGPQQQLQLKVQYSEEVSDETYLGLTDVDFSRDENRRYGMSDIDEMENRHSSIQLNYAIELSDTLRLSAVAYDNNFSRNWFKLDGGSAFIDAANRGDTEAQEILAGTRDVAGLRYKHNNRDYESTGLELNLEIAAGNHQLDVGARTHEDSSDRFQPVEIYDQVDGALVFQRLVLPGQSDNRKSESDAFSAWLIDDWQVNEKLKLTAALRYEDVESDEVRYGNPQRSTLGSTRSNDSSEWLPGLSFTYDVSEQVQLLAGVHRGFSPLGGSATREEDPETSNNWEAGIRYNNGSWFLETIGFYSDFSEKVENCSLASPCSDGSTSGTFTTGEAVIQGVEFQASRLFSFNRFRLPLDISYTWTDAEISRDNAITGVTDGDELKDVPEHVYSIRTGLEHDSGWNNYLVAKYVDEQCSRVGCNRDTSGFAATDSVLVFDLISRYTLRDNLEIFLKIENLFDEQEIVSRDPDGARPNKPRTGSLGLAYSF